MFQRALLTASLCLVAVPSLAAEPEKKTTGATESIPKAGAATRTEQREEEYSYNFSEDLVSAVGNEASGSIIRIRPNAARITLIRPRTQFVTELLKSAERF